MSRKIKINGQLVDFETLVSRDNEYKNKIWRYRKDGEVEAVDATSLTDDDIVFSGSKSNLRRLADIERNVSILSTKVLTATNTSSYDVFDDNFGSIFDQDVRFKGEVRIDSTPTSATDAATKGYVDTAISNVSIDLTGYATETYVDTAVSNLVDAAPTTLDTLNELAAALGDDPNFATTITAALGNKADASSLATVATSGAYSDLTGTPTIPADVSDLTDTTNLLDHFSGNYNDLTNKPTLFDGQYSSLTGAPTIPDVTSADLDMGTNKILYSNVYNNLVDLPSASSYHGMFAHVHGTGKAYYAHAGSWVELANVSELPSLTGYATETFVNTAISNLVNGADAAFDTLKEIQDAMATDTELATAISNLVIPSDLTDLGITDGTANQVLVTDGAGNFTFANASGGSEVSLSATAPSTPTSGDLWYSTDTGVLYIYDGTFWISTDSGSSGGGSSSGGASIELSDTAPTSPTAGMLWFKTDTLDLYVYFADNWVEVGGGSGGSSSTWEAVSSAVTIAAGDKKLVDTSSAAVTVTLPATPSVGDEVRIIDAAGNAATNNITVARNGSNIMGLAEDFVININEAAFGLVYFNASRGWVLTEK